MRLRHGDDGVWVSVRDGSGGQRRGAGTRVKAEGFFGNQRQGLARSEGEGFDKGVFLVVPLSAHCQVMMMMCSSHAGRREERLERSGRGPLFRGSATAGRSRLYGAQPDQPSSFQLTSPLASSMLAIPTPLSRLVVPEGGGGGGV